MRVFRPKPTNQPRPDPVASQAARLAKNIRSVREAHGTVVAAIEANARLQTVERLRLALLPPVVDEGSPAWQRLVRDYLDAEVGLAP